MRRTHCLAPSRWRDASRTRRPASPTHVLIPSRIRFKERLHAGHAENRPQRMRFPTAPPRPEGEFDSFHESSRPLTQWTTVNYGEATPGVPTPLTWSFFCLPIEMALRSAFHEI